MNTTFTTYAAKAKQILNLLQGYTKGIRMTAILVLLLMGVSNAWGADNNNINNITSVYIRGGMNGWLNSNDWKLSQGSDANNWKGTFYLNTTQEFKMYINNKYYACDGKNFNSTSTYQDYLYTDGGSNMKITRYSTNGANGYVKLDVELWGNYGNGSYNTSRLQIKQSLVTALSPSLSASSTSLIKSGKSTITASCSGGSGSYTYTYKVTCDGNDVTNSTLSPTTGASVTFTAPSSVTGKKTYTITVTAKDSHALLSGLATKTATKTITVEEAHNVTVSYKYGSTTIKANTTTSNVKYGTASSITAPAIDGYKFANWTLGNGITNKSANTTTNPISITTKSSGTYTLTANYTEDLTSTWHIVGEPTSIFMGTSTWAAHNDNMLRKTTGASTASKGSLTIDVKALPASNDSYQFKVLNTNGTKWYGWSTGDNHYWMNQTNTTGVYTDQNNLYFIPNALGDYKFDVDWSSSNPSLKVTFPTAYAVTFGKGTGGSSVTAKYNSTSFNSGTKVQSGKTVTFTQTPSAGYAFKEWNTKSDGTGTTLSTNETYTHTVAATNIIYAIYTKKPDKTIYLEPTGHWNPDKAVFQAHVWQTGETTGVNLNMTGVGEPSYADSENKSLYKYYKVEVPAEYDNILFFRKGNFATANENAWNKTSDLKIPTDDKTLYVITNNTTSPATGEWKVANLTYGITLNSSAFGEYGFVYDNTKYFSPESGSKTYQIPINATVKIFSTPYSDAYRGDVTVTKRGTSVDYESESIITLDCDINLDDNYKTTSPHVVYLAVPDNGGDWISSTNTNNCLRALHNLHNPATDIAAGDVVTMTEAGRATIADVEHIFYRCEIPAGYNTIRFEKRKNAETWDSNADLATKRLFYEIPLNSINCYRLSGKEDNFFIGLWESAPGFQGDYRLLHVKEAGVSYPSDIIRNGTAEQTVSLHIYKKDAGSEFPKIELQKYNSETKKWDIVTTKMVKDISKITADSEDGAVWNFVVKVNDGTASVDYEKVERYTGDYYIRTNNAEGGWRNYTISTNKMTFSSYAKAHSGYTHYFCRWIDIIDNSTEPGHNNNVKFIVANDYGAVISNEFAGDTHTATGGILPEDANVRWSWNEVTNTPSRAYILGAYGANAQQNENIVVTYNTNTEEILDDQENWIYEIDLKDINQGSELSILQATYPSKNIQVTFKDAGVTKTETVTADQQIFASNLQMINADNDNHNTYTVRVMYDFKINKTLVMLLPNQGAETGVDVFIERTDQGDATQVAAAVTRDDPGDPGYTIYATMTFTKEHLESTTKTEWERLYYWVSFPFDVRISDVFGFGEYGKQWIMEYYDGAERARKGYYEGSTFWKFITDTTGNNGILHANQGYVLALARSIANQGIFANGNEYVRLYFPSKDRITSIDGTVPAETEVTLDQLSCTIPGREIYDSHWHLIGVPSYANKEHTLTQKDLIYYYDYQTSDDTYKVTTAQSIDDGLGIPSSGQENVTFKSMHAYFVQYAGTINWTEWATTPQSLAQRRNSNEEKNYSLRLELQKDTSYADQTFVLLKEEGATEAFDMNIDLTKMMNAGNNLYTLAGEERIQVAGNVVPVREMTIPVGVKLATDGEYTFSMPDGTGGMVVELIDYELETTTNLLLFDYTVTLPKGTNESRFALHIQPNKSGVTTGVENVGDKAKGIEKYLIDGKLVIRTAEGVFDAQGKRL